MYYQNVSSIIGIKMHGIDIKMHGIIKKAFDKYDIYLLISKSIQGIVPKFSADFTNAFSFYEDL